MQNCIFSSAPFTKGHGQQALRKLLSLLTKHGERGSEAPAASNCRDSVANQMLRMDRLDGIGPARSADGSLLQMINEQGTIKVLNGNVLPK